MLTVNKFKQLHWGWVNLTKVKKEKIKDIKNCYRIKHKIIDYSDTYEADQLFLEGIPIKETSQSDEYTFRLTSNGGISGDNDYMLYMTNEIEKIVVKY